MHRSEALHAEVESVTFPGQTIGLVIPFFRSTFSDVNNTLAMGIIAFIFIEFWGFQALGFGYLSKFFNLKGIMSFVGILELLSEFIRVISFTFRLFGNIFAGEVLILMLTFLMPFLLAECHLWAGTVRWVHPGGGVRAAHPRLRDDGD